MTNPKFSNVFKLLLVFAGLSELSILVINAQSPELWASPCPRLFSYEPRKENDRWYGTVTLTSDTDLKGVWLRLAFDRTSLQLGNWFGEIRTSDNIEYLIHNRNHELKANMPYALRFYIKYDPNGPPPQLVGIRLNARPVCPEGQTTTPAAITGGNQLFTNAPDGKDPLGGIPQGGATTPMPPARPVQQGQGSGRPGTAFIRPGGGWPGSASNIDDDDDVFQGDFQLIGRPHLRPQAEPECGTVVMSHEWRKRRKRAASRGGANQPFQHTAEYHRHDAPNHHNHNHHTQGSGLTPNFPPIEYFYVDNGGVPMDNWNLHDWILSFLNQRYDLSSTTPSNFNPSITQTTPRPILNTPTIIQNTPTSLYTPTTNKNTPTNLNTPFITTTPPKTNQNLPNPYVGGTNPFTKPEITVDDLPPINPEQEHAVVNRIHSNHDDDDDIPLEQQPRPLITYGESTQEGEFPWHSAIYHERGADLQYLCGGSLISRNHVLTAAHCVTRRRSASTLNPDSLLVYLGKYYLKKWSNPGIQGSQVSLILAHGEYNSHTFANDIALLKLLNPVSFTDYVRPICLWGDGQDISGIVNKPGTVVGWGFDHTGKVTEQLTQAKMPVVTKETCIYSFPDFFSRFTTSKTFCAGFKNGTSVCNGDSGGGLIFPKQTSTPHREVWQLRGLVSLSAALQNQFKCDSSHYVVFTDVAKYLDWIRDGM